MAFWRFGFHSQSSIDSILSSNNPNTCLTTSIILDKLLDEDDLLQEIKAQHPKLIEFLATNEVVLRMLSYISGCIFDDEADESAASRHSPPSGSDPSNSGMGGAILNSIRNHTVGDKINALLMDALDSEGRTPEDRAKAEKRKVRFPYLCSEIIASDIWNVTSQIFNDPPQYGILTKFWDSVLDQPPSITAHKSIQLGHWARTNIALISSKPNEMINFIKSYPNLIPKLISHFNSSPVVDLLFRIIQCEATHPGIIDWLIDQTDFVELIVSFLHPCRPSGLHLAVADFLKNIISFCTTNTSPLPHSLPLQPAPANTQPSGLAQPPLQPSDAVNASHPPSDRPPDSQGLKDDGPPFITIRLMRELTSATVVSKLLSFGLDAEIQADESLITTESITSSIVNSLSILIDLIRRNNSDFSESQIFIYLRDLEQEKKTVPSSSSLANLSPASPPLSQEHLQTTPPQQSSGPAIVPLMDLLDTISARLPDLQHLIKTPHSSTKPIKTTVGSVTPLTLERFRIVELYAELLHCSNMIMVNRPPGTGPVYDQHGHLLSGMEELVKLFEPPSSAGAETELNAHEGHMSGGVEEPHEVPLSEEGEERAVSDLLQQKPNLESKIEPFQIPAEQSTLSSTSATPDTVSSSSGTRFKRRFMELGVLNTCFDLFFEFPWNNFLHNVVFDIVQQTLNAKFGAPGGEVGFELAMSLFDDVGIVQRILEGVELNRTYGLASNGVRLGNMAHLILIADETLKALDSNPEIFNSIASRLSSNSAWQEFITTYVSTARMHSCTSLGGTVPHHPSGGQPQSLSIDGDSFQQSLSNKHSWSIQSSPDPNSTRTSRFREGDDFVQYFAEHIRANFANSFSSSASSSEDENEGSLSNGGGGGGGIDDEDDPWATGKKRSLGGSTGGSVISNPTPFGFDDRFDAPSRSFPTRFGSSAQDDDEDDDYELDGFGDDFGPFSDAAAIHQVPIYDPFTLTTPASSSSTIITSSKPGAPMSTPKPGSSSLTQKKKGGSFLAIGTTGWAKDRAGEGEGQGSSEEGEEDWGAFAAAAPPRLATSMQEEEEREFQKDVPEQDIWTDFDLGVSNNDQPSGSSQHQWSGIVKPQRKSRSRAGSASSRTEPFGPGVKPENIKSIGEDGKLKVELDDGSLITVPLDEVLSAVVSSDQD